MNLKYFVVISALFCCSCTTSQTEAQPVATNVEPETTSKSADFQLNASEDAPIIVGADRWEKVLEVLGDKQVGAVVNHTSTSGNMHLVDRMLESGVNVKRVFAPEHGFRGVASDGEKVVDQVDSKTGLPILSLYGKTKRPTLNMLDGIDVLVFDIQDVGTRFYTYISTMHYVMDAAAEFGIEVVVLDRPNPNGHFIDGPVLDTAYRSFIGMHPIPVVHGLTVGELARLINGAGWLSNGRKAELTVVEVDNYEVGEEWILPIKPSPNLPNQQSIYLYPTLCFFEGTIASIGRGTDFPFQVIGHPKYTEKEFSFTPEARPGAQYAKLKGETCFGENLQNAPAEQWSRIRWELLTEFADKTTATPFIDRNSHFDACVGSDRLRRWIDSGQDIPGFSESYKEELDAYRLLVAPYLMYPRTRGKF